MVKDKLIKKLERNMNLDTTSQYSLQTLSCS